MLKLKGRITQGHDSEEKPTKKKRKLSTAPVLDFYDISSSACETQEDAGNLDPASVQKAVIEEFDLEISLRKRFVAAIEYRISWAMSLYDSLSKESLSNEIGVSYNFGEIAQEALRDIEIPCDLIVNRDPSPWLQSDQPTQSPHILAQIRTRSHRIRDRSIAQPFPTGSKLLFIRDNSKSPPIVAKMACPDCSREDFTNLQGLLNHCRIRHSKDYGSHDECIQRCAVVVADEEKDWVLANGTELTSVGLPSLRRLFEIAVGNVAVPATASWQERNHTADEPRTEETPKANHLTKTLGHHKDTPGLAPFLGRTPRRRCINVYNENEYVDIERQNARMQVETPNSAWRMSFAHRNETRRTDEFFSEQELPAQMPSAVSTSPHHLKDVANSGGTRFHVLARVVVSDRSLWLAPRRRGVCYPANHTHRWMLSADSTSYSLHITAFLTKVTMTCLADPPPYALSSPESVSIPPFTFVGTTDKPFLACLKFEWAGPHNPPMEVQHWVELDFSKAANPILGDEQVLDIELDRNTSFLPVMLDYEPPSWETTSAAEERRPDGKVFESSHSPEPAYITILKSLLPLVPMTLKDAKGGRVQHQLPYKLVPSPAQFRSLTLGRRKAIEWGRAKSLLAEYEKHVNLTRDKFPLLTTADIFCWMVDEGLFLRDTPKVVRNPGREDAQGDARSTESTALHLTTFCSECGVSHQSTAQRSSIGLPDCPYAHYQVRGLPMMNLGRVLSGSSTGQVREQNAVIPMNSQQKFQRDLIAISDPMLTLAIRDVVALLRLETFCSAHCPPYIFPITELGANTVEVDHHLAPYAILSLATRSFLGLLVKSGLHVAHRDWTLSGGRAKNGFRILTPSHIFRGMYNSTHSDMWAALACCQRIGLPLDHTPLGKDDRDHVTGDGD